MSNENIQLVISAKDTASRDVQNLTRNLTGLQSGMKTLGNEGNVLSGKLSGVQSHLLGMTKDARLLKRETFGISKFANALDTVAGTRFGNLISDLTTVADVAHPLKDLGQSLLTSVETGLSDAWAKVAARPAVASAIDKAGQLMSGRFGTAIKAFGVVAIAAALTDVWLTALEDTKQRVESNPNSVTPLQMFNARAPMWAVAKIQAAQAMQSIGQSSLDAFNKTWDDGIAKGMNASDPALLAAAKAAGEKAGGTVGTSVITTATQVLTKDGISDWTGFVLASTPAATAAGTDVGVAVTNGALANAHLDAVAGKFTDHVLPAMKSGLILAGHQAASAGAKALADTSIWDKSAHAIGSNLAQALRAARPSVRSAMKDLNWAIDHPMAEANKKRLIEAKLNSKKLADALASKNPMIHDQAAQTQQFLIDLWQSLTGQTYGAAAATSTNLDKGLASKYPEIIRQAKNFVGDFNAIFAALRSNYHVSVGVAAGVAGKLSHIPTFASGGDVSAGTTALVGEKGPEVVTFGSNAHITPNGAGKGADIVLKVDGRELFRIIDGHMGKALARSSGAPYTRG